MKGTKNIWPIPEDLHKLLHSGGPRGGDWNRRWWEELKEAGGVENASVSDVVRIREQLVEEFGLGMYRP